MKKLRRPEAPARFPGSVQDSALTEPLLALHRAMDLDVLWQATVQLLDAAVPNFHLIAALPFEGMAPMVIRTTLPEPDIEAFWLRLNAAGPPMAQTLMNHPGLTLSTLDDDFSEEEIEQSRFYKEIMEPGGWRYSAGLFFWEEGHFVAHLGVVRTRAQGQFSEEDKAMLAALHPHLDAAMKRLVLLERHRLVQGILFEALEHPFDGLVLMNVRGGMVFHNQAAALACKMWKKGQRPASLKSSIQGERDLIQMPREVQAAAQAVLGEFLEAHGQKRVHKARFEREIKHADLPGLAVRLFVVVPVNEAVPPHLRLEFSRVINTPTEESSMPVFRLSDAERRVAELVARGLSNEEVAKELGISVNTVRTHLRVVFDKLHLTHRGQLRARLGR
jgi:DNA-binding CsgD family transcriptional regulator